MSAIAGFGPAVIFACSLALLACYWPFARVYQKFVMSPETQDFRAFAQTFDAFGAVPGVIRGFWYFRGAYYTWWAVLAVLTGILLWRLPHLFKSHPDLPSLQKS